MHTAASPTPLAFHPPKCTPVLDERNPRVSSTSGTIDPLVIRAALKEFLLHGAKYAFPATLGSPTRGIPTAYAAPPLATLVSQPNELPPVWPDAEGNQRGVTSA